RVHAGHLKYNHFVATDLDAAFSMSANKWNIQKVGLKNSDGSISLSGTLTSIADNNNAVQIQTEINHVNVSKLFTAFDNFGLSSLHAKNIRGILTSKANLNAVL